MAIACGFAPQLAVVGLDAEAVYALTAAGEFYRVDTANHATTLLYSAVPDMSGYVPSAAGTALRADRIYFTGAATPGSTAGVLSIDAKKPSQPEVIVASGVYRAGAPLVVDASAFYWEHCDGSALDAVYRAPLTGGAGTAIFNGAAEPVAALDGFLYLAVPPDGSKVFPPYGQLVRVPSTGGLSSVVIAAIDPADQSTTTGVGCLAVDAANAYMLGARDGTGQDPVEQFSLAGGSPTTLAEVNQPDGEVPIGPPPPRFASTAGTSTSFRYWKTRPSWSSSASRPPSGCRLKFPRSSWKAT